MSKLINRIDPRYIAGVGTLMAAVALYGFSRLSVPDSGQDVLNAISQGHYLGSDVSYWTKILPFVCLMALGMGAVFVPLTLTAVHHLRPEDAGVGSGVLNTMQQVGGAFGLAALSTVGSHFTNAHIAQIAPTIAHGLSSLPQNVTLAIMDKLEMAVQSMEERTIDSFPDPSTIRRIFRLRRQLRRFDRIIGPMEAVCDRLVGHQLTMVDPEARRKTAPGTW